MKKLLYIFFAVALLFSCTRLEQENPAPQVEVDEEGGPEGKVLVRFSVTLPELTPSTKALGDTPAGDLQNIYIAVFGSSAYLKEYVQATPVLATQNGSLGGNDNRYEFVAQLTLSENSKRRIHIIGNGPDRMDYDQETTLIPALLSEPGQGAYWQSFIVPGIKAKRDADGNLIDADTVTINGETVYAGTGTFVISDETQAYFNDIPLIRNFAKIVVEDVAGSNFVTKSFAAVNVPTQGSLAPYYDGGFVYKYEEKSYTDLKETLQYPALLPIGTEFNKTVPSKADFITPSASTATVPKSSSFFLYERPVPNEEQEPTVVIIYGHYTDPDTDDGVDSSGDYFYKVDLMENKDYYPIYRNFKYRIQIRSILKPGAETPEDALVSMGSGDVSADISTQTLTDISDGQSRILVTYMTKTLIRKYPYEDGGETVELILKYKYIPDVNKYTGANTEPDHNNNYTTGTPTEANPVTISLQSVSSDIITSYTVADSDDTQGWRTITITTDNPTANMRSQYLRISGTVPAVLNGTEVVREESTLYRNVTYTMLSRQTMTVTCNPEKVVKRQGEQMEVGITIPKNLPASMFPLKFYIEAEAMSLTPDNGRTEEILQDNNLPVVTGDSIIDSDNTSFQFVRTLSKTDYDKLSKADKFKSGNTVTLSCFFKTNKAESASAVYVSNEYFNTANDSFGNYKIKDFTNLMFTDGVSNDAGVAAPFSFHMDESDPLPEKVYFQFDGVRPTATSGLVLVNDSSDPHNGWYWYSPTATTVAALANNYTPIINLATTRTGATATVTIEADEYNQASYTFVPKSFPSSGFYTTAGGNTAMTSVSARAGRTVYYRFSYDSSDSDLQPVKLLPVGLGSPTSSTGTISGPDASGYYTYTPTRTATTDHRITWTTQAVTGGSTSSVTLSSAHYVNSLVSTIARTASVWRTGNYTINLKTNNGSEPSFTTAPQNVVFNNTEQGGSGNNRYQSMGTSSWFTYYSGSFTVNAPSNYEDSRITRIDMAYNQSAQAVTVDGDVSGSTTLSTKTRWNSSSTGEGNGDTTVTVTMACTSRTQYNNRNQLTSITVYYGYWDE